MIRHFITILLLQCICVVTNAQTDQWQLLKEDLDSVGIMVAPPLENRFQTISEQNNLVHFDFAIKQRKGDLEIRYLIKPADSISYPHIDGMSLLTTLATNDQESAVSVMAIKEDVLEKDYKADWGFQAFFKPKISFSSKANCKLIGIYKEGKAIAYMALLFDEADIDLEPYEFVVTFD